MAAVGAVVALVVAVVELLVGVVGTEVVGTVVTAKRAIRCIIRLQR